MALAALGAVSLLAAPAAADPLGVGVQAEAGVLSWSQTYDADGTPTDVLGTRTELPFMASLGYTLPLSLGVRAGFTGVRTTFSPDGAGDNASGTGLRELVGSIGRSFYPVDSVSVRLSVGGKLDIGQGPDDVDLLDGELPTSNGLNAGTGNLTLSAVNAPFSPRLSIGGVYNLPAGDPERAPGPIVNTVFGVGYGTVIFDLYWALSLDVAYTLGATTRVGGEKVENSDFNLLHVTPALAVDTDYGTFRAALGAQSEDFYVGFAILGKNAPVARGASLSWSSAF